MVLHAAGELEPEGRIAHPFHDLPALHLDPAEIHARGADHVVVALTEIVEEVSDGFDRLVPVAAEVGEESALHLEPADVVRVAEPQRHSGAVLDDGPGAVELGVQPEQRLQVLVAAQHQVALAEPARELQPFLDLCEAHDVVHPAGTRRPQRDQGMGAMTLGADLAPDLELELRMMDRLVDAPPEHHADRIGAV